MRTAEEYLKEKFPNADQLDWFKSICECLNTARREVLEEAMKKVNLQLQYGHGTLENKVISSIEIKDKVERTSYGHGDSGYEVVTVNKQPILNMIKELK